MAVIKLTFQLADSGECQDEFGLSARAVANRLKECGCPFEHDRVRRILQDPIYATGEFTTTLRGVRIAQRPVRLSIRYRSISTCVCRAYCG